MRHRLPSRARVALATVLSGLALACWGSPGVAAAEEPAIEHAQPIKGAVRLLVSVPGTDSVDTEGVRVTIAGRTVGAEAAAASADDAVERTSILAIDTSLSMAGQRIAEAKKAATSYLSAVPDNVRVGVLTFDDDVEVVTPPGFDRDAARAAIAGLRLTRETSLYDGVLGALDAVGTAGEDVGQRKVLVLSDGRDTTDTDLEDVVGAIRKSAARVDVVSLQKGADNAPLQSIAEAGRGTVLTTEDPAALSDAFEKEAADLARQLVVTAQLPPGFEDASSDVKVTIPTEAETFTATAYVPVRSAEDVSAAEAARGRPQVVGAGPLELTPTMMYVGVGALGAGLLGLIVILAVGKGQPSTQLTLTQQVQAYGVMSVPGQPGPRRDAPQQAFAGQARQAAEKALANNRNLEARIASALESAGLALRPSEWLLLRAALAVAGGLLGVLLGAGSIVLGILFVLASLIGPWLYLKIKRARRLKAFGSGLADTLQLMSGSLSAGLSLAQSIDTIVREGTEPIAGEFRRVVVESRLGVTLEDALDGVAQRMHSRDFAWVVMAIRIQREVGGNLAELLLTVAGTLRERDYLRRHVRALSAEGRLSCWILGGLPPVFLLYLSLSKPDYVKPMFTTPIGWLLCIGMTVLLGVGVLWMSKVAKVDV
jgi:tight adherence protein B